MLRNQGVFDDPDGITTDGTNEVRLLHKGTRHQAHCLGPCVFRYGVVLITFDRLDNVAVGSL